MARIVETASVPRAAFGPVGAYIALTKPKAIPAHFLTATAAMFLAGGGAPRASLLLLTLLGGGCVCAAANAFNCVIDRDIDARMSRTRGRPLPSGLIRPEHALVFAWVIGLAGVSILGALVSRAAALLSLAALAYYVFAYTLWLRRRTRWGTVIGSAIGAIPPVIGWVVVADRLGAVPLVLAAIIILWTVPHFWSLVFYRRRDYAAAGLRILPERGMGVWITVCSALLVSASLALVPAARLGAPYGAAAAVLGAFLLFLSARMNGREPAGAARRLYSYSVVYLAALFAAMIIDTLSRA
jgi:protoheme IX farnesyltransferase